MSANAARCPMGHGTTELPERAGSRPTDIGGVQHSGAKEVPVVDWLQPAHLLADPYESYARLRTEAPVAWVPILNKFLVTSYAGCHEIEQDQSIFSANVSGSTMNRAIGAHPMLRKDDPEHATDRLAVNPVLRPKNIKEAWAEVFARNADIYLDELEDVGPDNADLNRDYAAPLAAKNLGDLVGLKDVDVQTVRTWSHDFIAGIGNVLDDPEIWRRCESSTEQADALINELIPHYQLHPNASMLSAWANSGLPDANIAANVKLSISGGMNEPQHMVTNIVWALSNHPDQREQVLADPTRWAAVFDEAVRWLSPIGMYPRETTMDTVLEGVRIPAGSGIAVVVAAANHDPAQFGENAADFDINRPKKSHLAFGAGVHLCAGHWAAKSAIGQIAVPKAYERFPGLRIEESRPGQWAGWVFRGLTSLPVTWS